MADPTGIYDGRVGRDVKISSLVDRINDEFCVFCTHIGGRQCGRPATHWAVYKSDILQMCSDHGVLGKDLVHATIWGDGSLMISKKYNIDGMLRYTCSICHNMVPSADVAPNDDYDYNCTCKACATKGGIRLMPKPDSIYDAGTRKVMPIADWSKSIKGEKCSVIDLAAKWRCETSATHWAVTRFGIRAGCLVHLHMHRDLFIDEVYATIEADGIHFGKNEDRHVLSLTLGKILYYTCARCGIAKLSADINRSHGNAGENVCNDCSVEAAS